MNNITNGFVINASKIPDTIGIIQPFENASDFYLLKEDDNGNCTVIGKVYMSVKYHNLSIRLGNDETNPDMLKYFVPVDDSGRPDRMFGPRFDIFDLRFFCGAFKEDDEYSNHPDFPKLRLVPQLWAEFYYKD